MTNTGSGENKCGETGGGKVKLSQKVRRVS